MFLSGRRWDCREMPPERKLPWNNQAAQQFRAQRPLRYRDNYSTRIKTPLHTFPIFPSRQRTHRAPSKRITKKFIEKENHRTKSFRLIFIAFFMWETKLPREIKFYQVFQDHLDFFWEEWTHREESGRIPVPVPPAPPSLGAKVKKREIQTQW